MKNICCLDIKPAIGYYEYMMYDLDTKNVFWLGKREYLKFKIAGCPKYMLTGKDKLNLVFRYNKNTGNCDNFVLSDRHNRSVVFRIMNDGDFILYTSKDFVSDALNKMNDDSIIKGASFLTKNVKLLNVSLYNSNSFFLDYAEEIDINGYTYRYISFDYCVAFYFKVDYKHERNEACCFSIRIPLLNPRSSSDDKQQDIGYLYSSSLSFIMNDFNISYNRRDKDGVLW